MRYKVVIIDDFFSQVEKGVVLEWIGKLFKVKKEGYKFKHKNSYLPIAQDDMYCVHALIVDKSSGEIVMAFKVVNNSVCKFYSLDFPLKGYLREVNNPGEDVNLLDGIIESYAKKNFDFSYSGGWVVNPQFKGEGLLDELKDIYTGIHYMVHKNFNLKAIIGIALVNIGTDEFFKDKWGMEDISGKIHKIPSCPGFDVKLIFQDMENISEHKVTMAKKYIDLWNSRTEYSSPRGVGGELMRVA